jgi:hypothetical protein
MQSFDEGRSLRLDVQEREIPHPEKRVRDDSDGSSRDDNGEVSRVTTMATNNIFSANCGAGHRVNYSRHVGETTFDSRKLFLLMSHQSAILFRRER